MSYATITIHLTMAIYYFCMIVGFKRRKIVDIDDILLKQVKYTNKAFFKEIARWSIGAVQWASRDDVSKADVIALLQQMAGDAEAQFREFEGEEILKKIEI